MAPCRVPARGVRVRVRVALPLPLPLPLPLTPAPNQVLAPAGRQHAAWLGGAILGSLPTMPSMWISKEEYDENGPLIVHRKTF